MCRLGHLHCLTADPPGLSNVDDHWPPSADVVGQFDAVQVDTRSPSAALRILAAARGRGVVSVVDADVTPDTAILRFVSHAAPELHLIVIVSVAFMVCVHDRARADLGA